MLNGQESFGSCGEPEVKCGIGGMSVKIIKEKITGHLLIDDEHIALVLANSEDQNIVYVTYALYTMGVEAHVLPAVVLDDWGNEIRGMALYRWFREYGERFPRAEVFGVAPDGTETQYFLRDLELYSKFPVYAFEDKESPVSTGVLIEAIIHLDSRVPHPQSSEPPPSVQFPLREARVSWWAAPAMPGDLSFLG